MTEQSIKEEAILKIREAAKLLTKAGIPERFETIVSDEFWMARNMNKPDTCKDDEYSYEYFQCALGCNEEILFDIRKPKRSFQYALQIRMVKHYWHYSIIEKFKMIYKYAKEILLGKTIEDEIFIDTDNLTRFKEMLGRL